MVLSQDGDYISDGLEMFPNSKDYRKKKADHDAWCAAIRNKVRRPVTFPIAFPERLNLAPITNKGKQRHIWIIGPPGAGKTTWVETTFASASVYRRAAAAQFPFDNYLQEQIILYDDCWPKFEEIVAVSNYYQSPTNILGHQRYTTRQWKEKQHRLMIVLSNDVPAYGKHQAAVESRFRFIHLAEGDLLYDPELDPPVYGEGDSQQSSQEV